MQRDAAGGVRDLVPAGRAVRDDQVILAFNLSGRMLLIDHNGSSHKISDGQVWINGICKDEACASFDVKVITIQSTADISPKAN